MFFVIENYYLVFGRQMEKLLEALAHNLRKHIAVERMRSNAASCCRCGAPLIKKRGRPFLVDLLYIERLLAHFVALSELHSETYVDLVVE